MRKILTSILCLLFSFQLFAQSGWNYLPTAPTASRIDDVFFINPDIGVCVTSEGKIYKTSDAGATWTKKLSSNKYMRSVEFLNDSIGFAGTLYGQLYQTKDGGETWTNISALLDPHVIGICGLNAVDDSVIYGAGIWSQPAFVIKSTNSGESWSFMNMSAYAHGLVEPYFISADTGFVCGIGLNDKSIILYTADGGVTWETKWAGNTNSTYIWKIQFLNSKRAVACVASTNFNSDSEMLTSDDSGMTWQLHTVSTNYFELEGIGFINPAHGWVGGYMDGMFETVDSGKTWSLIPFGKTLNRYYKVNDTLIYSSGFSVYKYIDSAVSIPTNYTEPFEKFVPANTINSVSPNPSNDKIRISYSLSADDMADLFLCEETGKRVKTFVHTHQNKGDYLLNEDVSQFAAGNYFLALHTNEGASHSGLIRIER